MATFTLRPIGHVHSPFADTSQIPKGCGAEHHAEGTIALLPEFAEGLADIDGFSHLYVLWVFDRLRDDDYTLTATPPTDVALTTGTIWSPCPPRSINWNVVASSCKLSARLFVVKKTRHPWNDWS